VSVDYETFESNIGQGRFSTLLKHFIPVIFTVEMAMIKIHFARQKTLLEGSLAVQSTLRRITPFLHRE
jgi:hypothetical protein